LYAWWVHTARHDAQERKKPDGLWGEASRKSIIRTMSDIIQMREKNIKQGVNYMERKYTCYCGLYCENCAVMAKVAPAAVILYDEMKKAGFEEIVHFIPGGDGFWPFLKGMAEDGVCVSCRDGSGNPGCAVRICAKEKDVDMCALCSDYPCDKFAGFFKGYPVLEHDNALLREKGWEAWAKLQDKRRAKGYILSDL